MIELPQEFVSRIVANNRELLGLPPQSATFCCVKDAFSPEVRSTQGARWTAL